MFTGIIMEIGTISRLVPSGGGLRIGVHAPHTAGELKLGDSVAVNGVCQTVIRRQGEDFDVEAVEETLRKTTFGELRIGTRVNLELPLTPGMRIGGHLVQGHVDAVGRIRNIQKRSASWMVRVEIPRDFEKYVVPVGSIAVDGVSLTVAELDGQLVGISVIPHTMEHTVFTSYRIGDAVNVEFDILGKYVERLLRRGEGGTPPAPPLTPDHLRSLGY